MKGTLILRDLNQENLTLSTVYDIDINKVDVTNEGTVITIYVGDDFGKPKLREWLASGHEQGEIQRLQRRVRELEESHAYVQGRLNEAQRKITERA